MISNVEISLNVIERFNLSEDEIKLLIDNLKNSISPNKVLPKPMTKDEVYALNFEKWMIKTNLYRPKYK